MSKVFFTEPAEYDIQQITGYIRRDLKNKTAAIRIRKGIIKTAKALGDFPKKHPRLNEELDF